MNQERRIRVAVNGYGVIGKRVAAAVVCQPDLTLAGVSDVVTEWRTHMVIRNGFRLFGATAEHADSMRSAGTVSDANESIAMTNAALGIDTALIGAPAPAPVHP